MANDGKLPKIKEMLLELDDIRDSCEKISSYGICQKECDESCLMNTTETRKKTEIHSMVMSSKGGK